MAIPWLIGAAAVGIVGYILSDDDSSSSSSSNSDSRRLERESERAESERKAKIAQAEKEAQERRIAEQNRVNANRFINKFGLSISADSLVAASKNDNLEVTLIQAYKSGKESTKRTSKIEQVSKQLNELEQLENDFIIFLED